MKAKDRYERLLRILLAVGAAVSLLVWALEEASAVLPEWSVYGKYLSAASFALDACVLGIGLAFLLVGAPGYSSYPVPFVEIASSLPVIVFSSAPLVYAYFEGNEVYLPAAFLVARSLRILRLRRVFPVGNVAVLAILAVCEMLRSFLGAFLPDPAARTAALRLLLLPESLLLLAAAATNSARGRPILPARKKRRREKESQVGEEELEKLLGKKSLW